MARCFPFPPPGFVPMDLPLIDSIEKESKRKHEKKENKEKKEKKKKSEKLADATGEKADKKHREKGDKKHKDKKRKRDEKSKTDQTAVKSLENTGEGSGTTEEQGLPGVRYVCGPLDGSQDNAKRRKVENIDDGKSSQGTGLRIRLPLVKNKELSQLTPVVTTRQADEQPAPANRVGHTSLTDRQFPIGVTNKREPSLPVVRPGLQPQAVMHLAAPMLASSRQPPSPVEFIQQPSCTTVAAIQTETPNVKRLKTSTPTKHLEIPPLAGKHPGLHPPTTRQKDLTATVNKAEISMEVVKKPKEATAATGRSTELAHGRSTDLLKQSEFKVPSAKSAVNQHRQPTSVLDNRPIARPARERPFLSGERETEWEKVSAPFFRNAEMNTKVDRPCIYGSTEATRPIARNAELQHKSNHQLCLSRREDTPIVGNVEMPCRGNRPCFSGKTKPTTDPVTGNSEMPHKDAPPCLSGRTEAANPPCLSGRTEAANPPCLSGRTEAANPAPIVCNFEMERKVDQACFSGRTKGAPNPIAINIEMQRKGDRPCLSGRTEAAPASVAINVELQHKGDQACFSGRSPAPVVRNVEMQHKGEQATFSGRTETTPARTEATVPPIVRNVEIQGKATRPPVLSTAKIQHRGNQQCLSGKTEADTRKNCIPSAGKPEADPGFTGSKSSRRKEAVYRDIIEKWTPPQLQVEQSEDLDWLSIPESRQCKNGTDGKPPLVTPSCLSSWPPQAQFIAQVNVYALPYVLPF